MEQGQEWEIRRGFMVELEFGLHARPAAMFVKAVCRHRADVTIIGEGGVEANGKSILSILLLAAGNGTRLTIVARGDDAREAMLVVEALFVSNFGETRVARLESVPRGDDVLPRRASVRDEALAPAT